MKSTYSVIIGERSGRLVVLEEATPLYYNGDLKRMVKCKCDCGTIKIVRYAQIRSGGTRSCGCLQKEGYANNWGRPKKENRIIHEPLYAVWSRMKQRCSNETLKGHERYVDRGVRVCDEWINSYPSFRGWALANGWKKGMEIDKDIIPQRLGIPAVLYSPDMCSVVTRKQNCNARRTNIYFDVNGEKMTLADACRFYGVESKYKIVHQRMNREGLSLSEAVIF